MSEPEKPKPDLPHPRQGNTIKNKTAGENLQDNSTSIENLKTYAAPSSQKHDTNVKKDEFSVIPSTLLPENINRFATPNPNPSDLPFRNESYFGTDLSESPSIALDSVVADTGFTFLSDASPTPFSSAKPISTMPFSPRPGPPSSTSTSAHFTQTHFTQTHFSPSSTIYDDISLASPICTSSSAPSSQTKFNFQKEDSPTSSSSSDSKPPSATNFTFFDDASPVSPRTERIQKHLTNLGVFGKSAHSPDVIIAGHAVEPPQPGVSETQAAVHKALFDSVPENQASLGDRDATPTQFSSASHPVPGIPSIFGSIGAERKPEDISLALANNVNSHPNHRPVLSRGKLFTADPPPLSAVTLGADDIQKEVAVDEDVAAVTISISATAQATCISIRIPGRERIEISPAGS